jgi:prephenate dehydratase
MSFVNHIETEMTYVTRTSKAKTLLQHPPNIRDKIMGRSEASICNNASAKLVGLSISDSYQTEKGKVKKNKTYFILILGPARLCPIFFFFFFFFFLINYQTVFLG